MADRIIKPDSGNRLVLQDDGGGEAFAIETTQDVNITNGDIYFGTAGKGIVLGATSNVDANTLDDYEEGDHTAVIVCGTSGTIALDASSDTLTYTKIGRLVTVCGNLVVGTISSPVGFFTVSLPFPILDLTERGGRGASAITLSGVVSNNVADFCTITIGGESVLRFYVGDSTSFVDDSAQQMVQDTTSIFITFNYFAT